MVRVICFYLSSLITRDVADDSENKIISMDVNKDSF